MKIKGRKVTAFISMETIFCAIYFLTLFFKPDLIKIVGKITIVMMFAMSITFIGGNALDKWTRSKYFNKDLIDK